MVDEVCTQQEWHVDTDTLYCFQGDPVRTVARIREDIVNIVVEVHEVVRMKGGVEVAVVLVVIVEENHPIGDHLEETMVVVHEHEVEVMTDEVLIENEVEAPRKSDHLQENQANTLFPAGMMSEKPCVAI